MYFYNNKINTNCKNSAYFSADKNKFAYIIDKKVIIEEDGIIITDFSFSSLNSIKIVKNKLLISDEVNNLLIYDMITYLPTLLNLDENIKVSNWQNFHEKSWIIEKEKSIFESILGVINLENNTYYLKEDFYPDLIIDEFIFGKSYFNQVARYSIDEGNLLWETDISEIGKYSLPSEKEKKIGEVKKIIGIYNNQLIAFLSGGKFISLNIENGQLLWEQNKIELNNTSQIIESDLIDPYNIFLDKEKGLVYILQGEVFIILNLETQRASYEWNINDEESIDNLFIRQSKFFNNQIYFTAFRKGNEMNDDTIGIFDISKKEIIWKYSFQFQKGNFIPNNQDNLQISSTNLYVLDFHKSIHIFEKE